MSNLKRSEKRTTIVLCSREETYVDALRQGLSEKYELVVFSSIDETAGYINGNGNNKILIITGADFSQKEKDEGLALIRRYRNYMLIPVLLITDSPLTEAEEHLLIGGEAEDVLSLPMSHTVLNKRLDNAVRARKLEMETYRDTLTGLLNRNSYDKYVKDLKQKKEIPISFLAADCNGLKAINDKYGHSVGNEYLRMCGLVLRDVISEQYNVFRTGGDEFLVVFEDTALDVVKEYANKVEEMEEQFLVRNKTLSLAVGTSCWTDLSSRLEDSINLADKEMHRNKLRMKAQLESVKEDDDHITTQIAGFIEKMANGEMTPNQLPSALREISEYFSLTNSVTGLPNSGGYSRELEKRVSDGTIGEYDALFFNLRSFGLVNQRFGDAEGDECIRRYAKRIREQIRDGEIAGHVGGDNFTALIRKEHTEDFIRFISAVEIYADKDDRKVPVTVLCRIGVFPIGGNVNLGDVMSASSAALNIARTRRRDIFVVTPEFHREIMLHKVLAQEFPIAMAEDQVKVYYQPKVDYITGKIVGAEALARWSRGSELLGPSLFVPMLEQGEHSLELDLYMLRHVCQDISKWQKEHESVPVSVNFSRSDLVGQNRTARDTAEIIHQTILQEGVDPKLITIEVTETTDAEEQKFLFEFLTYLQDCGMKTSIDDFGTGYSSLSLLRDFPVNEIKIDKSFISHPELDEHDEIILKSIIEMAKQLKISVITEGVEREEQAAFLHKMGCDLIQGFMYDKPLPKEVWEERLMSGAYDIRLDK